MNEVRTLFRDYTDFVLIYFVLINSVYFILNLISLSSVRRHKAMSQYGREVFQSRFSPAVSILVPAFNEDKMITQSVRGMLLLEYPQYEVIVINDGSNDRTLDVLIDEFGLELAEFDSAECVPTQPIRGVYRSLSYPNLTVVDKQNGGKADAQNAGINVSIYPLICVVDADSIIEQDALYKVAWPFLHDPNRVIASGGTVRLVNDCSIEAGRVKLVRVPKKWITRFQVVEYLRAFMLGRLGWSSMHLLLIISGAFGLFNKEALISVGGYQAGSLGEDMELVTRMHRRFREWKKDYRIVFVPDPVCWTEAPEDLKTLSKQRNRWHRGLIDTLLRHRKMMFNPKYSGIGMVAFPYYVFFELIAPIVEMIGYVSIPVLFLSGYVNVSFFWAFMGVALLYGMLLSICSVIIEEISFHRYEHVRDLAILLLAAVIENLGFRQMTTLWRCRAFYDYFTGNNSWGEMSRKGFDNQS